MLKINSAQLRGRIFEELLRYFLNKQGYSIIPENIREYYGVRKDSNGLNVRGRGGWHQIDALGQFQFRIPFVYPIRLLSEAKCHKNVVGLPIIRNFVGVLKDISENYFIEKYSELEYKDRFRFTDCGAIFSTSEFTKEAQTYAYAQGIYLVPIPKLLAAIEEAAKKRNGQKFKTELLTSHFLDRVYENRNDCSLMNLLFPEKNIFFYFGIASGFYPIAIVSEKELPLDRFKERDEVEVKIQYNLEQKRRVGLSFSVKFEGWSGAFDLPRYMWEQYLKQPDFEKAMLDMKEKKLNIIEIPLEISGMRRIISLKLDKSWIEVIRNEIRKDTKTQN